MKNLLLFVCSYLVNAFHGGNPKADPKNTLTLDDSVNCGNTCADCAGLVPSFDWTIGSGDSYPEGDVLGITPTSDLPAGDTVSKNYVYVDQQPGVTENIYNEAGTPGVDIYVDLNAFDPQKPLYVRLKVVTVGGCVDYVDTVIAAGWNREQSGQADWEQYPPLG